MKQTTVVVLLSYNEPVTVLLQERRVLSWMYQENRDTEVEKVHSYERCSEALEAEKV